VPDPIGSRLQREGKGKDTKGNGHALRGSVQSHMVSPASRNPDIARNGNRARIHNCRRCWSSTARIGIGSRASRDRRRGRGRDLPAFRRFRSNLWRRRPAASACEGVRPGVSSDRSRALSHAAGLDGAGTPCGQARRDSGSPGPPWSIVGHTAGKRRGSRQGLPRIS
jgi:hypothetical protein